MESFPSLGARSHLGKWRHDEVLSIPIIKDMGRSGVRTVGCQRSNSPGWTLCGGRAQGGWWAGRGLFRVGGEALTPHKSEHAAGASLKEMVVREKGSGGWG